MKLLLSLDSVLPLWECPHPPLLPCGLEGGLVGRQGLAHGAGALLAQVQGHALLVLEKKRSMIE